MQPHTMYLAELAYRAEPTRETLERWDGSADSSCGIHVLLRLEE